MIITPIDRETDRHADGQTNKQTNKRRVKHNLHGEDNQSSVRQIVSDQTNPFQIIGDTDFNVRSVYIRKFDVDETAVRHLVVNDKCRFKTRSTWEEHFYASAAKNRRREALCEQAVRDPFGRPLSDDPVTRSLYLVEGF